MDVQRTARTTRSAHRGIAAASGEVQGNFDSFADSDNVSARSVGSHDCDGIAGSASSANHGAPLRPRSSHESIISLPGLTSSNSSVSELELFADDTSVNQEYKLPPLSRSPSPAALSSTSSVSTRSSQDYEALSASSGSASSHEPLDGVKLDRTHATDPEAVLAEVGTQFILPAVLPPAMSF